MGNKVLNNLIFVLVELVIFLFETIYRILRAISPTLIFALFFILQGIEITGGLSFLIMMGMIGGLLIEMRVPTLIRSLISDNIGKQQNG